MSNYIKNLINRRILLYKTDNYLISFPKSGRTWLRTIINNYYSRKYNKPMSLGLIDCNIRNLLNKRIPCVNFTHFGAHSKSGILPDLTILSGRKVILLVRDPRDVVVSYYFQCVKRDRIFQGGISDFIRHDDFGFEHIIDFMNHIYNSKNIASSFLMVRYEDIMQDAYAVSIGILEFIDSSEVNISKLKEAIEFSRFENMKKMEEKGSLENKRMKPGDIDDPESFKVRKGKVGAYMQYLSANDLKYISEKMKKINPIFGYE